MNYREIMLRKMQENIRFLSAELASIVVCRVLHIKS